MDNKIIEVKAELSQEEISKLIPKEMLEELSNGKGEGE